MSRLEVRQTCTGIDTVWVTVGIGIGVGLGVQVQVQLRVRVRVRPPCSSHIRVGGTQQGVDYGWGHPVAAMSGLEASCRGQIRVGASLKIRTGT